LIRLAAPIISTCIPRMQRQAAALKKQVYFQVLCTDVTPYRRAELFIPLGSVRLIAPTCQKTLDFDKRRNISGAMNREF
jgi:hypothetical protein